MSNNGPRTTTKLFRMKQLENNDRNREITHRILHSWEPNKRKLASFRYVEFEAGTLVAPVGPELDEQVLARSPARGRFGAELADLRHVGATVIQTHVIPATSGTRLESEVGVKPITDILSE